MPGMQKSLSLIVEPCLASLKGGAKVLCFHHTAAFKARLRASDWHQANFPQKFWRRCKTRLPFRNVSGCILAQRSLFTNISRIQVYSQFHFFQYIRILPIKSFQAQRFAFTLFAEDALEVAPRQHFRAFYNIYTINTLPYTISHYLHTFLHKML